ncbi:MAG: orotidine-5'-phosphate decarboxylase [Desulfamplus sp.]|nr:orotidine-5'-phosphate decarboxylase [Desulfamplus sp.]
MKKGKDYIVFALDVTSADEAEKYVNILNGKVGMFKIGLELFIQTGPDIIRRIKDLSDAGIFLDLKFHDISETVKRVMERAAELGVDLVTVHCSSSQKMLEMAVKGGDGVGVLGVTVLTDHDASVIEASGFKDIYVDDIKALVIKRAQMAYDAGCCGVVCSGLEVELIKSRFGKDFMAVTPGIRPAWLLTTNKLQEHNANIGELNYDKINYNQKQIVDDQKRITTPAMAVKAGADLIVVGRPIKTAADPALAAEEIAYEIDQEIEKITKKLEEV